MNIPNSNRYERHQRNTSSKQGGRSFQQHNYQHDDGSDGGGSNEEQGSLFGVVVAGIIGIGLLALLSR